MRTDYFGERVASRYDESTADISTPEFVETVVRFLVEQAARAGAGPVLEFGVGTGRIALPLSAQGLAVHGIDLSDAMLDRLRAKAGAERLQLTQGDFAQVRVDNTFHLVYLAFNTIMNLTEQDAQVDCFRNAAEHLILGGRFVVEVMVPDLQRLPFGETFRPFDVTSDHLGFDEYDVATQGLVSHHLTFDGDRVTRNPMPFRYVWPAELDLMARLAGLRLRERWAGWRREPFTSTSTQHVSVYEKIESWCAPASTTQPHAC